jgi:PAS domain S-box-containing protein
MENHAVLLENALDAVIGIDEKEIIIYWNHQAEKIFGWSKSEALGQNMADLIVPERMRESHRRGMKHFLMSGEGPILNQRIEVPATRRNGDEFMSELTVSALRKNESYQFYSFIRDISLRNEAETERTRLLQEARNAVKARDEFIGICSHELKTPITSLKLQFQMAERQIKKGDTSVSSLENVTERIQLANRQLDRIVRLINDMLDVSRISIDRLHIHKTTFDLSVLIKEVVDQYEDEPKVLWAAHAPVMLTADRDRIEQVILNLITNGIKYGNGKPVEVSLSAGVESVKVYVKDHGIGIAPENQERIFQKFERAISSNEISGLGIGLYITTEIVKSHHGRIWVESESGKGSIFTVEIPL